MDVGGEDILALGSDFDGIEGELEIAGAQDMPKLAEGFRKAGFSEVLIEKIFYRNAMRFFEENL
jgi:membrane dipeptidase